ncbi:helix-turn-helix transcriptional regulator [Nocardia sp. NBC_01377]
MAYRARLRSRTALRDVMSDRRIPVRVLARRAGCGKSIVGLLRSGARMTCTPAIAAKLAAGLDIPAETLFRIEE